MTSDLLNWRIVCELHTTAGLVKIWKHRVRTRQNEDHNTKKSKSVGKCVQAANPFWGCGTRWVMYSGDLCFSEALWEFINSRRKQQIAHQWIILWGKEWLEERCWRFMLTCHATALHYTQICFWTHTHTHTHTHTLRHITASSRQQTTLLYWKCRLHYILTLSREPI